MSFHTFELKQKICDGEQLGEIYEALSKSGGKFYRDKKEYLNTWVCETLRDNGIIIKIRRIKKNDFKYEMIYYRINPRRVMDDNDYIGLFDEGETAEMLDRVNELIWNTFDGALPSADGMKLNRIDFCKNAELDSQDAVKAYIELLKRGRTLKKYTLQKYDNPTSKRKTLSKNGLTYIGENGVNITYYNKFLEMSEQSLPMRDIERLNRILRIEIQCKNKKVKRLYKKYRVKSVREFLCRSDEIGEEVFKKYSSLFCGIGNFYRLDMVKTNIERSNFKTETKKNMTELVEYSARHSSLDKAVADVNKKYGKDTVQRLLKKFDKIKVSPVVIPRRSVLKTAESPFALVNKTG